MNVLREVLNIVDEVLGLEGRAAVMTRDSRLLGALPEFDSMAVVAIITTLEERFGFAIDDDELDASRFETVGTLTDFVTAKLETTG